MIARPHEVDPVTPGDLIPSALVWLDPELPHVEKVGGESRWVLAFGLIWQVQG
jgi:hypothetical protein